MPDSASASSISFAELWKSACILSGNLKRAGLNAGDRAIIMIPMSIDLYITLLAVVKSGAIAVFVDPWIPAKRMAAFANFAEPTAFIGIGKSHWLRFMEPELRKIDLTVTTGRRFAGFPARYKLADLKQGTPDWSLTEVTQQAPALITFTSGSSAEPKGANRTHQFLRSQHQALNHEFPWCPADIDMPMFPIFALNNLVSGITSVIPNMDFKKVAEVQGATIARQMRLHSVTTCTASPPFIDRLCDQIDSSGTQPELRRVLTGGAPVSNRQLERWRSLMPESQVVVAYGSTEAEPVGHIDAVQRLELDPSEAGYCTGKTSELVQARVIHICKSVDDLQGRTLEELTLGPNQIGELVVSGQHVCRDYYRNPQATAENKLRDMAGNIWHRMGDTGRLDSDGRFWLAGRLHSTITRDSAFLHPQLIEQMLSNSVEGLTRVAAVGVTNESLGQACWIVAEVKSQKPETIVEIQSQMQQHGFPCDNVVLVTNPLPVDPRHNSKIDYDALRQQLEAIDR